MKFFGHPIHPLLIHFPTALLPMDLVLSVLHAYKHENAFALAGFYCLAAAVAMGILAMITGLIDLLAIPKTGKQAMAAALTHGFVNGIILIVFATILYREWQVYPQPYSSQGSLVFKGVLVVSLFAGNFLGGQLIYKHHIGIDLTDTHNKSMTKP
jgi:uncharacterized membrane protein